MRRKTPREQYEEWLRTRPPDPPEWARIVENKWFFQPPDTVRSPEDALRLFGHILWDHKDLNRSAKDAVLAEYIRQYPFLIALWLEDTATRDLLAFSQTREDARRRANNEIQGGIPESLLSCLFYRASPEEGALLSQTIQVSDSKELLTGLTLMVQASRGGMPLRGEIAFNLPRMLAKIIPASAVPEFRTRLSERVSPSLMDTVEALISNDLYSSNPDVFRFPALLPPDDELAALSADEIANRLATYYGLSLEAFHQRLSQDNFLKEGEHIGEVILKDVQTLQRLGVSREVLADTLVQLFKNKRYRSCRAEVTVYRGHHCDPFHYDDTYYLSRERCGSADVVLRNTRFKTIRISDMAPYMIRRACFFEGNVPYRADPEILCSMLGLV